MVDRQYYLNRGLQEATRYHTDLTIQAIDSGDYAVSKRALTGLKEVYKDVESVHSNPIFVKGLHKTILDLSASCEGLRAKLRLEEVCE